MTTGANDMGAGKPAGTPAGVGDDAEVIPISALEHMSYCPRQCGLIHLEQTFDDNVYTVRGSLAHQRLDEAFRETRPDVRREFALPLWSRRLGLIGRADVVELSDAGPYPVEHKVGKKRRWRHEAIQLCAQAMCLEEMLGVPVLRGAIYYRGSRARREVEFDEALREEVADAVLAVRAMLHDERMPTPANDARCEECSLRDACLPNVVLRPARERAWRAELFRVDDADDLGGER